MSKTYVRTPAGSRLVRQDGGGKYVLLGGGKQYIGGGKRAAEEGVSSKRGRFENDNEEWGIYREDGDDEVVLLDTEPDAATAWQRALEMFAHKGDITFDETNPYMDPLTGAPLDEYLTPTTAKDSYDVLSNYNTRIYITKITDAMEVD